MESFIIFFMRLNVKEPRTLKKFVASKTLWPYSHKLLELSVLHNFLDQIQQKNLISRI